MSSSSRRDGAKGTPRLSAERLEPRDVPAVSAVLTAGNLVVVGTGDDRIDISTDNGQLVVADRATEVLRARATDVSSLSVSLGGGDNTLRIDNSVTVPGVIATGPGRNRVRTGAGSTAVAGNSGLDVITIGPAVSAVNVAGGGADLVYRVKPTDAVTIGAEDSIQRDVVPTPDLNVVDQEFLQATLTAGEVERILDRAVGVSPSNDAIIAIVDRNGRILGVRVESGVAPEIVNNREKLIFAIDGAVAKARTGAFFANNESPLTSRTIQTISETTMTQREIEADPNILDPDSTDRGPGYVAAIGIAAHFPRGVPFTPQVDLFGIEHTNRDGTFLVGPDDRLGTADDIEQARGTRFNIPAADFAPGKRLFAPDSIGVDSGLVPGQRNRWQNRGIATLPGGIPIYKNNQMAGGIGVFFPGTTGFASEENSTLNSNFDPTRMDRSVEAELIAFVAAGGAAPSEAARKLNIPSFPQVGIQGVRIEADGSNDRFGIPFEQFGDARIDLVGIQLEVLGPGGLNEGRDFLLRLATALNAGTFDTTTGFNVPVDAGGDGISGLVSPANGGDDVLFRDGLPISDGFLVRPMDGNGITAAEVSKIIADGLAQAEKTRAAIRLPVGARAKFVFAVADRDGKIVGLFRMADATIFSIDVAVAKARNANYYADAAKLQPADQLGGVPAGTAFTARTFRYLAHPRFPFGIDGTGPAPFSQLNDGGSDPITALQVGPRLPASAFQSVYGYDSFNPGTNFRDPTNQLNRNGIVFFPGSAPVYRGDTLIGGFGVSGDGVDQDDVVTADGVIEFGVPLSVPRADQVEFNTVKLPFQKFNRNPEG